MIINIDLIPELLSECGITPRRTKNLASDHTVKEGQLIKLNGRIILVYLLCGYYDATVTLRRLKQFTGLDAGLEKVPISP